MAPQHPSVFRRARVGSWKRGAVNAATAALAVLLLVGAGPRAVPQEQDSESQPVDKVEVTKATGTVKKVDTDRRKLLVHLDDGRTKAYRVDKSVKNLDQFPPGARLQVSSTEEIIMMADKSNDGVAAVAKYDTVTVTPEGETPPIVKVDTTEITQGIASWTLQTRRITLK